MNFLEGDGERHNLIHNSGFLNSVLDFFLTFLSDISEVACIIIE
jgi:hypothetical protein